MPLSLPNGYDDLFGFGPDNDGLTELAMPDPDKAETKLPELDSSQLYQAWSKSIHRLMHLVC